MVDVRDCGFDPADDGVPVEAGAAAFAIVLSALLWIA
jgi:hypothetical protein